MLECFLLLSHYVLVVVSIPFYGVVLGALFAEEKRSASGCFNWVVVVGVLCLPSQCVMGL